MLSMLTKKNGAVFLKKLIKMLLSSFSLKIVEEEIFFDFFIFDYNRVKQTIITLSLRLLLSKHQRQEVFR
jgi:hypothetical protein